MDRYAAVVLPIVERPPFEVLFIERAHHLRRHAGEIAFPGGAIDDADGGDHERAALREMQEEIGLGPADVRVIARLQPLRQRVNAFTVTPFVGIVAPGARVVADPGEVAAVHRVPLAAIVAPGAVHPGIETIGDRRVETTHFDHGDLHVWGLTGRILASFVERWHAADSPLRAALDA